MTRRHAIKVMGAGAALVGMGAITRGRAADAVSPADSGAITQPFVLPKLAYGFDGLEPHIDALTMEIHYTKHHAAYIKNANKALEGHPELGAKTGQELLTMLPSIEEPLRTTLRNNVGGHVNHTFWWSILSPQGGGAPEGALAAAITREFGSYEAFKTLFTEAAMKRFGSGWAWLVSKGGRLSIASTANQDSPISGQFVPLIGLDVWEHAYYLKHQNVRADYVKAFWNVVDWKQAGARYVPLSAVTPSDS
jgi:Fe-Mn family superoxide dismutase